MSLEFFDTEEFEGMDLEVPPFLVEDILPYGGIGILYAKEGHGKSQLAMTLAKAIVNGESFLGRYQTYGERVAFVSLDMPRVQFQERVKAVAALVRHKENLYHGPSDSPIDILKVTARTPWVKKLVDLDPNLIIWDTLHKLHVLPENDSLTPIQVYKKLQEVFPASTTHLLLHHEGKDSPNPDHWRPEEQRARGSSAWMADADLGIRVYRKKATSITVSFPRLRFCADQPSIICEMNPETLMIEPKEGELTTREFARKVMLDNPGIDREAFSKKMQAETKVSDSLVRRLARELFDEGE